MLSREFAFFLFVNYAYIGTWMHVRKTKFEKKKTVLWGTITWSEMGKQNLQAKNVFWKFCEELTSQWLTLSTKRV